MRCLSTILTLCCVMLACQFAAQGNPDKTIISIRYRQSDIYDSVKGIGVYDRLIEALQGDSLRKNTKGFYAEGWTEDRYQNGQLLHRGFYKNGKLSLFKNFYENGVCERSFVAADPLHCRMELFYDNGEMRRQINYYNGAVRQLSEFYPSGLHRSKQEFDKEGLYLVSKKTWYSDGSVESELKQVDAKSHKYSEKHYYPNGHLKDEALVLFSMETKEYTQSGPRHFYDASGKRLAQAHQ